MITALFPPYGWKIKAIAGIVLAVSIWFAFNAFTDHYREQGRDELRPRLETVTNERNHAIKLTHDWKNVYNKLGLLASACSDSVEKLHIESEAKLAASAEALAKAEAKGKHQQAVIDKAEERASNAGVDLKSCEQAVLDAKEDLRGLP
jgi:hypothetical protein